MRAKTGPRRRAIRVPTAKSTLKTFQLLPVTSARERRSASSGLPSFEHRDRYGDRPPRQEHEDRPAIGMTSSGGSFSTTLATSIGTRRQARGRGRSQGHPQRA